MAKHSAGIIVYRFNKERLEILLVHPGGPFWSKKDVNAWSIPKGELSEGEETLEAAKREFYEETGVSIDGEFISLGTAKQSGGKIVHAWAIEVDIDPAQVKSNTFSMEWPPKSGKQQEFPEIDQAGWFPPDVAKDKIHQGQVVLIDRLVQKLEMEN